MFRQLAPCYAVCLITVVICSLRVSGHTDDLFKTIAHLWVAGLIGFAIGRRKGIAMGAAAAYAVLLTAVETGCFIASRL